MTPEPFSTVGSDFLPWMAGIQARALILLAVTGIAVLLLRRSSAAIRHLALSLAALSLLALPLLSVSLPSWTVSAPPRAVPMSPRATSALIPPSNVAESRTAPADKAPAAAAPLSSLPTSSDKIGATESISGWPSVLLTLPRVLSMATALALLIWAIGASLLLLRIGIGLLRLRQMALQTEPATVVTPELAEEFSALSASLDLRETIRLVVAAHGSVGLSPMTWGFRRPVVLLPAEAAAWPMERLRPVLLHELAHIQRADWATELMARVACALYWPNPLVWMLVRRLQIESECACDDRVLLSGVAPTDYAHLLVEVARGLKARRQTALVPSGAVMMAHESNVGNRVRAVLHGRRSRIPATVRVAVMAIAVTAGLLLPLANLRVASAGGQEKPADNKPIKIGDRTFYNGALPAARLLRKLNPRRGMTTNEYRTLAATRTAPGRDRFPNGVVAEGLYVTGMQPDGAVASWDRQGNLLNRGPNWQGSRIKAGELRFHIDRLKLPGTDEWIDKKTFDRLTESRAIESEFGVVGGPTAYFGLTGTHVYGNGYFNFVDSYTWAPSPPPPAKVDVYLTTSYGPWQTIGESRKDRTGVQVTVPGGGTVLLSQLVTRRGGVEAEVAASIPERFTARDPNGRPLWNLRMETLDASGQPIGKPRIAQYAQTPDETPGDGATRILFRFLTSELPFEKVASARLLARPMQTVYFRNVPTKPNRIPTPPSGSK